MYIHHRRTFEKYFWSVFLLSSASLIVSFFFVVTKSVVLKAHSSNCELCYVLFYWTAYYGTVSRSLSFRAIGPRIGPFASIEAYPSGLLHFRASGREKFLVTTSFRFPSRSFSTRDSSLGLSRYCDIAFKTYLGRIA